MICSIIMSQTSNSSSSGSRWARTKTKRFLEFNGKKLFRTVEKGWKIKPFGHSNAQNFFLKMPHFDHFPCRGEIDPYMPNESSEDSSNQLDGPMEPWIGIKDQVTDLFRPICPCWYLILDNIIWKYILYLVTLFLDKDLFAYGTPPKKKLFSRKVVP